MQIPDLKISAKQGYAGALLESSASFRSRRGLGSEGIFYHEAIGCHCFKNCRGIIRYFYLF
jgi:hypothetical protein